MAKYTIEDAHLCSYERSSRGARLYQVKKNGRNFSGPVPRRVAQQIIRDARAGETGQRQN